MPNLERWIVADHTEMDYYISQVLMGHGSFKTYTHRIRKDDDEVCRYCPEQDTVEHTVFYCTRWIEARRDLEIEVGRASSTANNTDLIIESRRTWNAVRKMFRRIMKDTEKEERELRERQEEKQPKTGGKEKQRKDRT